MIRDIEPKTRTDCGTHVVPQSKEDQIKCLEIGNPRRHEGTFGVPLSLIEPPHQPHDREESHSVVDTELEKKEGDDNEKVTKENRSPFHKNLTDD